MSAADPAHLCIETDRLLLRALGPGDEALLQGVFERCADHFRALTGAAGPEPDAALRELRASAEAPGRTVVAITRLDGGEAVGVAGWWLGNPEPDRALLGMLMVAPEHRGAGIAREALEGVEVWLAGQGMRAIRTAFQRRRLAVHPVVRALGFREMSIADHTLLGLAGAGISLWEKPVGG